MFKVVSYCLFFSFILSMVVGVFIFCHSNIYPIEKVVIQSDPMVFDQEKLVDMIKPQVEKNFFMVDVEEIQSILQGLPEVAQAGVKRIWPNKIIVQLILEQAVARWNEEYFLNNYGEIFKSRMSLFEMLELPEFHNDQYKTIKMLTYYQQINKLLEKLNLKINKMELDSGQSWCMQLNDGVILKIGKKNILYKIQRFVAVYPKILTSSRRAKEIDLRYEHGMGMAVEWNKIE